MSKARTNPRASSAAITKRRMADLPPYQRLQALDRVEQLKAGTLKVPHRCTHCRGTVLTPDPEHPRELLCGSCGKRSLPEDVRIIRQRELQATILDGPLEDRT